MSFFNFRNQNKFSTIAKILTDQEARSKEFLHQKHPHTLNIFEKHNVNLREVRRKSVKAATAATILGAFLSFPHLLGNPGHNEPKHSPHLRSISTEKQLPDTDLKSPTTIRHHQQTSFVNNIQTNSSGQTVEDPDSKSQGHIHGRSYLAPPKEHGLHDLGLHRGEDKGHGKAESPGPHPEDLGINHEGKNS